MARSLGKTSHLLSNNSVEQILRFHERLLLLLQRRLLLLITTTANSY